MKALLAASQRLNTIISDLQVRLGEKNDFSSVVTFRNTSNPLELALQRLDNVITQLETNSSLFDKYSNSSICNVNVVDGNQFSTVASASSGTTTQPTPSHQPNRALFSKAKIQVCKILHAESHPKADKLLVCKVQVDSAQPQPNVITICAGIKKYYDPTALTDKLIVAVLNLPHKQMFGISSQGMLLAGSNENKTIVKLIEPPATSQPGDSVFLEGDEQRPVQYPTLLSIDEWAQIATSLYVKNGLATYDGLTLLTKKGPITAPELPEGSKIS